MFYAPDIVIFYLRREVTINPWLVEIIHHKQSH